jgi:hypothetical protein
MASKLYCAYGSNLNLRQMYDRCPTAKVIGTGYLYDYQLVFKGVATVEPRKKYKVPVLVWLVQPRDEETLDIYEGIKHNLYRKEEIEVLLDTGETVQAMTYLLNRGGSPFPPSERYFLTILQGYADNNLPVEYLSRSYKTAYKAEKEFAPKLL